MENVARILETVDLFVVSCVGHYQNGNHHENTTDGRTNVHGSLATFSKYREAANGTMRISEDRWQTLIGAQCTA